ncbi:hypothetical protein BSR28_03055 [Boudabousia liubingyangii]|uniref:YlxR family protein n=1 Tax=Boudabousia liubingyangii TaxID=1921764 RepID=UPI00093BDE15|nr:YlxR family protein [Boudabousia liubingyangii]OKL47493.1 hypothetical protein BSR28_03055 [Boudabousia liubingyangii]
MSEPTLPTRTCVGCRNRESRGQLTRLVVIDGELCLDPRASLPGRGVWVHNRACFERASKRNTFQNALRVKTLQVPSALAGQIPAEESDS